MPPSDAGGGVLGHGGNCLGTERKCGHWPARVAVVALVAASRRVEISERERREGMRTKPSRWRASRRGVVVVVVVVAVVVVAIMIVSYRVVLCRVVVWCIVC